MYLLKKEAPVKRIHSSQHNQLKVNHGNFTGSLLAGIQSLVAGLHLQDPWQQSAAAESGVSLKPLQSPFSIFMNPVPV